MPYDTDFDDDNEKPKKPDYFSRVMTGLVLAMAGYVAGMYVTASNGVGWMKKAAHPNSDISLSTAVKVNKFFGNSWTSDNLQELAKEAMKANDFTTFDKYIEAGAKGMDVDDQSAQYPMQCRFGFVGDAAWDGNIPMLKHIAERYPDTFNGCSSRVFNDMGYFHGKNKPAVAAFFLDKGAQVKPDRDLLESAIENEYFDLADTLSERGFKTDNGKLKQVFMWQCRTGVCDFKPAQAAWMKEHNVTLTLE